MPTDLAPPSSDAVDVTPAPERHGSGRSGGRGPVLVVVCAAVLTAGALGWVLLSGGDGSDDPATSVGSGLEPAAADPLEAVDETDPVDVVDDVADDAEAAVSEPATAAPGTEPAPDATPDPATSEAEATGEPAGSAPEAPADMPQSRAVFRDGQVVLFGKVPTREVADEIFDLASGLLGPENVVDEYVIDPTVPAPTTGNLTVEETIEFGSGAAVLPDPVPDVMVIGAMLMEVRPTTQLRIIGHTDSRGSADANAQLSLDRADAVKNWIVAQGIDPARIETVGMGEAAPVASNDTDEGRRQNRRIEFEVQNILGEG